MRILAVDYGDARTGLAVCDNTEFLARPVGQLEATGRAKVVAGILEAAQKEQAERIVIGLPRNMDGTEGDRAKKCRKLADAVQKETDCPVVLWDERRTTVTAAAILTENGTFGKKRKQQLDAVSAVVILETYLAWRKNHPDAE